MSRAVTICQALLFRKFKEEFNATRSIVPGGIRSEQAVGPRVPREINIVRSNL